jgi:tRNA(fMet)-specific endonuclease VapC
VTVDRPDHDIVTTVVSFKEQLRAWPNVIGRYADVSRQVTYYERLAGLAGFFHRWRMLPFDDAAAQEFKRLRHERIRIGTADLKIAAIALTYQGTLLTSNLRDFDQVPGLRVEDWLYAVGVTGGQSALRRFVSRLGAGLIVELNDGRIL